MHSFDDIIVGELIAGISEVLCKVRFIMTENMEHESLISIPYSLLIQRHK